MSRRQRKKANRQRRAENKLWRGQQLHSHMLGAGGGGGFSGGSDSGTGSDGALIQLPDDVKVAPLPRVLDINLEEGDEIEMLMDDPNPETVGSFFFGLRNPRFKKGDRMKVFIVGPEVIVANGTVELKRADFGTVYNFAPKKNVVPKNYSEYAQSKTEEYYDKYILD
jgi:hypothetical protein